MISLWHSLFLTLFLLPLLPLYSFPMLHLPWPVHGTMSMSMGTLQRCTCSAREQLLFLSTCWLPSSVLWWDCYRADWEQLCPAHDSSKALLTEAALVVSPSYQWLPAPWHPHSIHLVRSSSIHEEWFCSWLKLIKIIVSWGKLKYKQKIKIEGNIFQNVF